MRASGVDAVRRVAGAAAVPAQDRGHRTRPPGTPGARLGGGATHPQTLTHARIPPEPVVARPCAGTRRGPDVGGVGQNGRVLLSDVVATSGAVTATRSRKAKVAAIAELLGSAAPEEIETVTSYLGGTLRQRRTGLGWRGVSAKLLSHATPPLFCG